MPKRGTSFVHSHFTEIHRARRIAGVHVILIAAAAVFDPIGGATYNTSLQLPAPRGCLINYGELSGPVPPIDLYRLFSSSVFVTKYNGIRWVEGTQEFDSLISDALTLAAKRPAVISDIAGRFRLQHVSDAYRALEADPPGKILAIPEHN